MAIEKMFLVNIAGHIKDLDCFVIRHILNNDIQVIKTSSIIDDMKDVKSFNENNPFEESVNKLDQICKKIKIPMKTLTNEDINVNCTIDIDPIVNDLMDELNELEDKRKKIEEQIKHQVHIKLQIIPIQNLNIEVDKLFSFQYMKFRFGKMPVYNYEKLKHSLDRYEVIVREISQEDEFAYILYFMPGIAKERIDTLFYSLNFERIFIPDEVQGKPSEALLKINNKMETLMFQLAEIDKVIEQFYLDNISRLTELYNVTHQMKEVFKVREYAMQSNTAFYLTAWVPESQLKTFTNNVKKETDITCIVSDEYEDKKIKPPTKLLNKVLIKPFEKLVELYGVPSYGEFDPTLLVAITYLLLFGMMFGDLGQGLVIGIIGFLIYKFKKNSLGIIGMLIGASSSMFGLVYGSVFGYEELLGFHIIHPMKEKQTILTFAISVGVGLIIIVMIINIIKHIKNKNYGKALVDKNGLIGLLLYLILLGYMIDNIMQTKYLKNISLVIALVLVPIFVIYFSHPLQNIINKRKHIFPKEKGTFFIEAFFELFEALLSILSNTVSFVRVGAFALNHAGFFMAFQILGEMQGKSGSVITMIFGNILVIVLEGMIVAIQGLRLEYYELFSRFFEGEGTAFQPFKVNFNNKN